MPRNGKQMSRRRQRSNNYPAPSVSQGVLAHTQRSHGPTPLHHFVKTIRVDDFVCQGTINAESYADCNFTHNLIPGYSDLIGVFKRIRVNKITWTFAKTNGPRNPGIAPYNDALVVTQVDPSGSYASSIGGALEVGQPYVQLSVPNTPEACVVTRTFKPAVLGQVYGGVTAGYEPQFGKFVDLADTSIVHYGMRAFYSCPAAGSAGTEEWSRYYVFCTIDFDLQGSS